MKFRNYVVIVGFLCASIAPVHADNSKSVVSWFPSSISSTLGSWSGNALAAMSTMSTKTKVVLGGGLAALTGGYFGFKYFQQKNDPSCQLMDKLRTSGLEKSNDLNKLKYTGIEGKVADYSDNLCKCKFLDNVDKRCVSCKSLLKEHKKIADAARVKARTVKRLECRREHFAKAALDAALKASSKREEREATERRKKALLDYVGRREHFAKAALDAALKASFKREEREATERRKKALLDYVGRREHFAKAALDAALKASFKREEREATERKAVKENPIQKLGAEELYPEDTQHQQVQSTSWALVPLGYRWSSDDLQSSLGEEERGLAESETPKEGGESLEELNSSNKGQSDESINNAQDEKGWTAQSYYSLDDGIQKALRISQGLTEGDIAANASQNDYSFDDGIQKALRISQGLINGRRYSS